MAVGESSLVESLRRSVFVPLLAAAAALVLVIINETGYAQASQALLSSAERHDVQAALNELQRRMLDAESGQRGYLLTRREVYLEHYRASLPMIASSLEQLHATYDSVAPTRAAVDRVEQAAGERLSVIALTLESFEAGKNDQWRELLLSNIGHEKMEALRKEVAALQGLAEQRIEANGRALGRTLMLSRVGVNLAALVALVAAALAFVKARALDRAQTSHASDLAGERDVLEAKVVRRTAELTELARHLQTTREDERSRLARDLHDELGALLTAARLDVVRLKRSLGSTNPEGSERLARLQATLQQVIELKRGIIEDLRPSSLGNLGLVAALEIQAREFTQRTEISIQTELQAVDLDEGCKLTVYRLVQESLTNIAKYAQARHVVVQLDASAVGDVRVMVRDDGIGFDPKVTTRSAHGLLGMRYRIEAEGGTLTVDSSAGRGTAIRATLPAATAAPAVPAAT